MIRITLSNLSSLLCVYSSSLCSLNCVILITRSINSPKIFPLCTTVAYINFCGICETFSLACLAWANGQWYEGLVAGDGMESKARQDTENRTEVSSTTSRTMMMIISGAEVAREQRQRWRFMWSREGGQRSTRRKDHPSRRRRRRGLRE